jgi:hypothetical protein
MCPAEFNCFKPFSGRDHRVDGIRDAKESKRHIYLSPAYLFVENVLLNLSER